MRVTSNTSLPVLGLQFVAAVATCNSTCSHHSNKSVATCCHLQPQATTVLPPVAACSHRQPRCCHLQPLAATRQQQCCHLLPLASSASIAPCTSVVDKSRVRLRPGNLQQVLLLKKLALKTLQKQWLSGVAKLQLWTLQNSGSWTLQKQWLLESSKRKISGGPTRPKRVGFFAQLAVDCAGTDPCLARHLLRSSGVLGKQKHLL